MKILHIAESAHGGGAESVFRDTVIKLLENDKNNQHYIACIEHGSETFEITFDFNKNKQTKLGQIFSINNYRFLKSSLNQCVPDIIHLQNYGNLSPSIIKAIYEFKQKNVNTKIIQTVHTFEHLCSHHAAYDYKKEKRCLDCAGKRYKFKIFYRGCSRLGYLHSWAKGITSLISNYYFNKGFVDHYLTPSDFLHQCLLKNSHIGTNVTTLRNPMNVSFLNQKFNAAIEHKITFDFVYFGRFSEEKNLDFLVNSFYLLTKKVRNVRLVLIGQGPSKVPLEELLNNLNIREHVEFIDFLPINMLIAKLKECHVFVLSSKCFETASLVINEAVLCGLVPLVANHGAMEEALNILNVGSSFDGTNQEQVCEKMQSAIVNYKSLHDELEKSFDTISRHYNSERYLNSLYNAYSS